MFGKEQHGRRDFYGENAVFLRAEEVYSITSMVINGLIIVKFLFLFPAECCFFFYFQQQHLIVPQK